MFGGEPDDGEWSCEYCGSRSGYMHTCAGTQAESARKDAAFRKNFMANGKRFSGKITIEFEDCYDSEQAFQSFLDSIFFFHGPVEGIHEFIGTYNAADPVMGWKAKVTKE
jgi:hypothetical protein